jgi:hypothetical protein
MGTNNQTKEKDVVRKSETSLEDLNEIPNRRNYSAVIPKKNEIQPDRGDAQRPKKQDDKK